MNNDKKRMQIIADNITKYRKEKGITQKQLADAIGVTPSTITDYIKLRSAPSFGIIQKMADFFEIEKSDIDTTFKPEMSIIGDNNNVLTTNHTFNGDISGNVSVGASLNKEDLHSVVKGLGDKDIQEQTLERIARLENGVSALLDAHVRLENAVTSLTENQANVLANMKSVDETFKKMFEIVLDRLGENNETK